MESEADLLNVAPEDGALTEESEADVLEDDPSMAVSEVRASSRRRRVGMTQRVRRAAWRVGALFRPVGRRVRAEHSVQRAEAGSDFASQFCPCDLPWCVRIVSTTSSVCHSLVSSHASYRIH